MAKYQIFKDSGQINQERIRHIEQVVTRIARRSIGKSSALITPYPISNAVFGEDIKGSVLRYMFPCDGRITKGLIMFDKVHRNGVTVKVKISDSESADYREFIINIKQLVIKPNLKVGSGDRLEISINPVGEDKITEVWISYLWVPTMRDVEVKSFLLEELEDEVEKSFEDILLEEVNERV